METKSTLNAALLAAQKQMVGASKDSTNPHFKSRYADLESILDAVKGPLNDEGIIIAQPITRFDNEWCVITMLMHVDTGETLQSHMPIVCKDLGDPQKWGSAITYARRYSLQSLVALPAIDDDGNTASAQTPPRKQAPATKPTSTPPAPEPPADPEATDKAACITRAWETAKHWGCDSTDWQAYFRNKGFDSSKAAPLDMLRRFKTSLESKAELLSQWPGNPDDAREFLATHGGVINTHIDDIRAALIDAVRAQEAP